VRRPKAALWAIAIAGVVTAVVLVLLPRRHESPQRAAVSRYIADVDGIQQRMAYSLAQVSTAYRTFAVRHAVTPATARQLTRSQRTLATLRARVARLTAPPEARRLRALILKLVGQEAAITKEVEGLVRFAPAFQAAVAGLKASAARLSARLAALHPPTPHKVHGTPAQIKQAQAAFLAASNAVAATQADAITTYDGDVLRIIGRLRKLSPPPVFAPAYRAQVIALRETVSAGSRLALELQKPVRANVPRLSRAFTIATRRSQTVAAQLTEIAAVKAYNARVRAVGATADAVRTELARLQGRLP